MKLMHMQSARHPSLMTYCPEANLGYYKRGNTDRRGQDRPLAGILESDSCCISALVDDRSPAERLAHCHVFGTTPETRRYICCSDRGSSSCPSDTFRVRPRRSIALALAPRLALLA